MNEDVEIKKMKTHLRQIDRVLDSRLRKHDEVYALLKNFDTELRNFKHLQMQWRQENNQLQNEVRLIRDRLNTKCRQIDLLLKKGEDTEIPEATAADIYEMLNGSAYHPDPFKAPLDPMNVKTLTLEETIAAFRKKEDYK